VFETALNLFVAGVARLGEFHAYVVEKAGLPVTVTTDAQACTPPFILIQPANAVFTLNGGMSKCMFAVTLVLPFLGGGVEDVLHAIDLFCTNLYSAVRRDASGCMLTAITTTEITESDERKGLWAIGINLEFMA